MPKQKELPKFKYIEENYTLIKVLIFYLNQIQMIFFFDIEGVQDYVYPGKLEYLIWYFF